MSSVSKTKIMTSVDHTQLFIHAIQRFFKEKEFFDTSLIAGSDNIVVKAHRVALCASSKYFLALFRSSLDESVIPDIKVQNVNGSILNSIVNFMYTATIELRSETVETVLKAADLLQMSTLIDVCCDFMIELLEPCNCLGISLFAEEYGYTELHEKSLSFARVNFEEVCTELEFLRLDERNLNKFLSDDDLEVDSQETLFENLIAWFRYDEVNREHLICCLLLQHIDPEMLEPEFIDDNILKLQNFSECSNMLRGWLECYSPVFSKIVEKETKKLTFVFYHPTSGAFRSQVFNPQISRWVYNDWPRPSPDKITYSMIFINQKLIITGGVINERKTNRVECFDLQTMEWSELPPMGVDRFCHAMAVINGDLYVVGGCNETNWIRSVERYDFSTRRWDKLTRLPRALPYVKVVSLNGLLYVASEGQYHLKIYDPVANKWNQTPAKIIKCSMFGMAVLNGCIYTVGGEYPSKQSSEAVERYNPESNTWILLQSLTVGRKNICCIGWNDRLFACGGRYAGGGVDLTFEEYNPETNEWKYLPSMINEDIAMFTAQLALL